MVVRLQYPECQVGADHRETEKGNTIGINL